MRTTAVRVPRWHHSKSGQRLRVLIAGMLAFAGIGVAQADRPPLIFGSDHDYPPYEYLDDNGQPAGFNVDIMRELSRVMGRKIQVRLGPWPQIRQALEETGTVDISDMFYSESRARVVDFATPYTTMHDILFVRRDSPDRCNLNALVGREIIVQESSYAHDYMLEHAKDARIYTANSEPDVLRLLATGAHHCAMVSEIVGHYAVRRYQLDNLVTRGQPTLPRHYGLVVRKGESALLTELNEALQIIKDNGRYDALYDKWFLQPDESIGIKALLVTGAWIIAPLAAIALLTLAWSVSLRRQIAARTTALHRELKDHQRTNAELRASEARFRQLAEHVREVFWLFDPIERRVVYVSPAYAEVWGRPVEELYARPEAWTESILEEDRPAVLEAWSHIAQTGSLQAEYRIRCPNGDIRWIQDRGFPVRDLDGRLERVAGLAEDVTLRKLYEQQMQTMNELLELRVQERTAQLESANRDLESFSYSVSHDLRTPLRSLSGYAAILAEDYADNLDADARRHLERIQASSQHMGQLIDDLLRLSRISRVPITRETCHLSQIAGEIAGQLAASHPECTFRIAITADLHAHADPQLMRIALENLLANAVKYSGPNADALIEFGVGEETGETVYYVRDNGVGFDMTYADKLFTPFQRLHKDDQFAGTGIGLAIVQRIILGHGGRIWATGTPDQGATFYFTLADGEASSV